jgi:hypothetical protein
MKHKIKTRKLNEGERCYRKALSSNPKEKTALSVDKLGSLPLFQWLKVSLLGDMRQGPTCVLFVNVYAIIIVLCIS